jgi:RNA polymerase I-specific transcription initiation factor RRN7
VSPTTIRILWNGKHAIKNVESILLILKKSIVQDLWTLRLDQLAGRLDTDPLSDSETESQTFSSSSRSSGSESGAPSDSESVNTRSINPSSTPKLINTVALCYVATHLMRLPIFLGDFLQWIREGDLLYYQALKEVPKDMLIRLPGQFHPFLTAQSVLDPNTFHHAVTTTFLLYQKDVEMVFPPLNIPLYLFRAMKELALPIEVYPAFKRLATLVIFKFKIPRQVKGQIPRTNDLPEGQFVACLVIAVKLLYPFDNIKRYPIEPDDPGAAVMDWSAWKQALDAYRAGMKPKGRLDWEAAMQTTEDEVLSMSDTKIDDYLDYFTKTWTIGSLDENDKDRDFQKAMLDMFPIKTPSPAPSIGISVAALSAERSAAVQASMIPRRVITEEDEEKIDKTVERPGSLYKRYRKESNLKGHAKVFYEAVAELSGLSLKSVVRAVYVTEGKLQLHIEEEELLERFGPDRKGKGKERAE